MADPTLRMRPEDVKGAHREFFQTGAHNELLAKLKVRRDRTEMSEEDALSSIRKLDHVTKNRRAARKIARNKDTIQTLLGSIQSRPRFGKLVEFSVECLKNLAVDEVSIEEMIDEGALEVLMKVARLNPYNEKIAKAVNLCIKSFAINDYLAKKIIDHVGAGTFNFSLKKHVKPDTLESTCNAMVAVMKSVEGIDELVADGCVPCIKHVIDGNAEQIEVVTAATSVAATIASVPEYAGQLVESGLAESVLVALRHNSDDPQLARIGADFVGRLAASKDEAVLERLKALEAVDVLVAALEANPHDAALLEIGAAALGVLTDESSMGTALEAVQVGDQSKPADMGMIASLCLVDSNIDYVIAHEGVGVIIAAVIKAKEMPDSPETRRAMEAGCRALMRLAGDETKIYKIMQERGVKAIVSVLSSHIDDEDIASAAIGALGRMMTREENATYIIRCKGLKAMVAALRTNPESATVAQYSIDMMASMAQFPSAVAKLMEYSCASDIIHAILTHSEEAAIVTAGIIGLSRLASLPENIPGIVKAGGVHAIMEVLNTHATEDEETALATLQLLATVASLPEAAAQLRDAGCMDSVLRVMEAHPDNAEIQEAGANALGLVVGGEEVKQSVGKVASLVAKLEALAAGASGDHVFKPLDPALKMLANLAAVSKNIKFFTSNGASDTLHSAFVLASECAPTQLRDSIMLSAMQGIARLAQHSSESEKMRLVTSGTLASLCAFVAAHPESGELYPEVLARLAHVLATASPEIAAAMMNDPTLLQNLMSIARAHPLNETVQAGIANFLCAMAQDEAAALGIIREGGAAVVVEAIYGNMSDKLALVSCLNALPALAVSEETVRALMDAGAVAAILDVMRNHPGEAEIIMRCVKALGSMLVVVDVAEQIGTKGGLPLLLRALRDHYAVEQLVEMNLLLLDSLALVRANADILLEKKHGTIALVEWAASTFKRNDTIQDAALRLLDTLLGIRDGLIDDPLAPLGAATLESLSPDDLNMMLQTLSDGAEPETVLSVLGTIAKVALDDEQASLIRSSNGFEILRSVLLENTEQEGVFRAATVAFQNLTGDLNEHPEVLELLQNPGMVQAVIEMLKPHSNFVSDADPAELVQALEILGQLASREANVASILANGGLGPLLRFLTSGNPDVMAAAAKALANLSNSDAAALELSRLIDIRALIQAMRNNFEMIEFLTYAVYLLARLAVNDDMKNRIGIEGGLQVIIQCMTTYSDNARLVENCCYALGELSCECDVNISFIMACKGVEALLQAMDVFPHKPALLDSAICALCNLCFNNDANKRRIVELGGCRHLVLAILDNVDSDELVMSAFRTLGNLSFLPTNIPTVIREGGVQAIVASMTYHHEHFDLIDMAMRVLGALAADVDAENMAIMAQEGAVQAIVDVAAQHTKNLDLQVTAVDSLCEFAREPTNARMIVRQGGLQSMVATMDVLHFDPELAENCLRLFALLSWNEANLDTMLDPINRVVTTVLDGLRAHLAGPPMLLGSGLQCLTRLAYNADSALTVARLGAVQCILSVAQQNLSQKDVLKYSFQSLGVLCRDETNAAAMAEQAMKFLVIALQTHGNDPQFANASFSFLSDLCVFPDAAQATLKVDIIQATLDVLNSCLDDHVLTVRRGLRALENMALSSDEVKVRLEDVGAVPRLERLRSRFEAREDVVGAVNRVLHAISMRSNRRTSGKHKPRSVKALFQAPKVDDLSEEVRNLLTAGQLFIKHSKTAKPRKRHVYVTADLKRLCWKEPHRPLKEKQQIPVYLLRTVEKGRATEQLQRKRKFGGYFVKHEEHAFAVLGRERTLDLEAANVAERNQWVDALTALIKWREDLKRANSQF